MPTRNISLTVQQDAFVDMFYRVTGSVVEIVRVLHERMDPVRHRHLQAVRARPRGRHRRK